MASNYFARKAEQIALALEGRKFFELKKISEQMIGEAAINADKTPAKMAVIAYALYKLLSKRHIVSSSNWGGARKEIKKSLSRASAEFNAGNLPGAEKSIESAFAHIDSIDRQLGHYAQAMLDKSRIKMASTAYSLELSLLQSAELTGAYKKDLQAYIGATKMNDEVPETVSIAERLKKLEDSLWQ